MTDVPLPKPPSMSMLASSAKLRYTERCLRSYGEACAQAERERIGAVLSDALQGDLEHGVKWLNANAASDFKMQFPDLFAALAGLDTPSRAGSETPAAAQGGPK